MGAILQQWLALRIADIAIKGSALAIITFIFLVFFTEARWWVCLLAVALLFPFICIGVAML